MKKNLSQIISTAVITGMMASSALAGQHDKDKKEKEEVSPKQEQTSKKEKQENLDKEKQEEHSKEKQESKDSCKNGCGG